MNYYCEEREHSSHRAKSVKHVCSCVYIIFAILLPSIVYARMAGLMETFLFFSVEFHFYVSFIYIEKHMALNRG